MLIDAICTNLAFLSVAQSLPASHIQKSNAKYGRRDMSRGDDDSTMVHTWDYKRLYSAINILIVFRVTTELSASHLFVD